MQNHVIAAAVLAVSLAAFVQRPSIGLLCLIVGGTWNLIDYWPDSAITDPYSFGNLAFNLADIVIVVGASLILSSFLLKLVRHGRPQA